MRIRKRDGTIEQFKASKITKAMIVPLSEHPDGLPPDMSVLTDNVINNINATRITDIVDIDLVQEAVENTLMSSGFYDAARAYISYREKRNIARASRLKPDPSLLQDYILISKYARWVERSKRRENWSEVVNRLMVMHCEKLGKKDVGLGKILEVDVLTKRVMPSMRSLQFGGAALLKQNMRMYNCSFTHMDRDSAFGEIFYMLLCGAGVGFSVQWGDVQRLPEIRYIDKKKVHHHTIDDTLEGWVVALDLLINSYIGVGAGAGAYLEYNYSKIRPEGSILITSGGRAPGHMALKLTLESVREILDNAQGRQLRTIEVFDIVCHVACGVLAGGIRRSSLLCLFDVDDTEMLYSKTRGVFEPGKLNDQRSVCNISAAIVDDTRGLERIVTLANQYGEPGFFKQTENRMLCNPCGEIRGVPDVGSFGVCNLASVNCSLIESGEDFLEAVRAATIISTVQGCYRDVTIRGMKISKNYDIGVSLTGIMSNLEMLQDDFLMQKAREIIIKTNARVAKRLDIPKARRYTCIKPSGTESLLLGCSAGISPYYARRYFRRVTANPNEVPAQYFKSINPNMVEQKPNGDWALVFPVQAPDNAVTLDNLSSKEHVAIIKWFQENWVMGHSISATVLIEAGIHEGLEGLLLELPGVALAPRDLDKIYPFAPQERVDDARWNNLISGCSAVDWWSKESKYVEELDSTNLRSTAACEGSKCKL